MQEPIIQGQVKVPENSKLIGKTAKEIKDTFNVDIDHRHNPHPSKKAVTCGKEYRLESDKFIHFSGTCNSVRTFTTELLRDC